jgi:hypothetical protein
MESNTEQFICDICRQIDFQTLLEDVSLRRDFERIMKYSPDCALCKVLFPWTPDSDDVLQVTTGKNLFEALPRWMDSVVDHTENVLWLATQAIPNGAAYYTFYISTGAVQTEFMPRVIAKIPNYALAKSWLDHCSQYHNVECGNTRSIIEGLRLINCEDRSIVEAGKDVRWIALSYVWGKSSQAAQPQIDHPSHQDGLCLPSRISQTVEDAITVTKRLGYRFLWVDEYCINQRSETHRMDQIQKMDQIYRGADLTIVAAAGQDKHHGLPGVGSTYRKGSDVVHLKNATIFNIGLDPERDIKNNSQWFKRAWTLQEGALSKRLLVFTEHQMSFFCHIGSRMEALNEIETVRTGLGAQESALSENRLFSFSMYQHDSLDNHPALPHFLDLARTYCLRDLTKASDTLNVFSGIVHHLGQLDSSLYSIRGLPLYQWGQFKDLDEGKEDQSLSWNVAKTLVMALAWEPRTLSRREDMFPSWTWAGWTGAIGFWQCIYGSFDLCFLRNIHFENSDQKTLDTVGIETQSHRHIQDMLDSVTTLHFEALVIPPTEISNLDGWKFRGQSLSEDSVSRIEHLYCFEDDCFENGNCSALLLGRCSNSGDYSTSKSGDCFILVVQWKTEVTAERVGAVFTSASSEQEELLPPMEEGLEWREVRLV